MSKILKRPMFRKGGSTNEGIVSMAVPRGQYADSNYEDLIKQNPDLEPLIKDANSRAALISAFAGPGRSSRDMGYDALLKGSLNLLSARPGSNIFETAARSFKEPVDDYLKEETGEGNFKRQVRLGAIQGAIGQKDTLEQLEAKAKTSNI
jgi:hypothetical protein